jgi:hypothetical protein
MSDCWCGNPACDGCAPLVPVPPVPEGVVVFDPVRWAARYPEFAPVAAATAQEYFYDATIYLDNTPCSPVCDASVGGERERLLYMMTAHLAYISGPLPGVDGSIGGGQAVGRPGSKAVGPVSVSYTGLDALPGSAAWFAQTKYGLAFWQATAVHRTFRYRTPFLDPKAYPGRLWWGIAYPWP